ncbi:peptide ABC transporter substrate-binding protein [Hyphomicrobium methylovorum]|uniref:GTP cyclohydrolase II n=1 Tax=Hyphomicrobium methylovorum TaxID=84 RepID=UPI0015E691B2|nr:GTP cyclohydrolase II [Hyphomicrobium methylovorum]MBA2127650.1 peptide ABC transporter substrate-binding protein [Hyphomicrobium methylovorum]
MKPGVLTSIELPADWSVETVLPIAFEGRELMLEAHAYQGETEEEQVLVLIHRDPNITSGSEPVPVVRIHSGCVTGDIFHSLRCDCYQQLQAALKVITEVPYGAVVYVPYHEGRGIGLFKKIKAYALQDQGFDTVEANIEVGAPIDSRDYGLTARILSDLGMSEIRLLSNNPAKEQALKAKGIRIAERLPLVIVPNKFNARYLETKRARMAHKL